MSVDQPAGDQALQAAPLSNSPGPLATVFTSSPAPASSPEADGKLSAPEENGEAEMEPMRNGAGHTSETESSDSGATPGDKENSTGAPQDMEGKDGPYSLDSLKLPYGELELIPAFWSCQCVKILYLRFLLVVQTWPIPVGSVSITGPSCWASSSSLPAYRSLRDSHQSVTWC